MTRTMKWACPALITLASSTAAIGQSTHIQLRVDIVNGSINGDGTAWGTDAFRFLQDALEHAADHVSDLEGNTAEIWVAAAFTSDNDPVDPQLVPAPYRPDQRASVVSAPCKPYGNCDRNASFYLHENVSILGGFPPDPHDFHGVGIPATILDRDPALYPTILSGDLRAARFNASAVIDGFIIRGGIDFRGAQPRFRDCVIHLHDGAAVRCDDASDVVMYRCTFKGLECDSLQVRGQSRLALVVCEPAAVLDWMAGATVRDSHASPLRDDAWHPHARLDDAQHSGRAVVSECSQLMIVDQAALEAAGLEAPLPALGRGVWGEG